MENALRFAGTQKKTSYTEMYKRIAGKDRRYNQLLVIRDNIPVPTSGRFPGSQILAAAAFPVSQWHSWPWLPVYSDEIAQDFHLLLFYPFAEKLFFRKRHLIFSYFVFSCLERQTVSVAPMRIIAHSFSKCKR